MRIAAIDIGTNSIHMIVVQVRPDLSFEVIDREKDMVRLGAGGLDGRSLTPTAMAPRSRPCRSSGAWPSRTKSTRSSPRPPAPRARPTTAATSSPRSTRQTGIQIRVISGTEEARLIHLAAGYGVDVGGATRGASSTSAAAASRSRSARPTQLTLGRSFKTRRHPADRALRQDAIRCRRATSAGW